MLKASFKKFVFYMLAFLAFRLCLIAFLMPPSKNRGQRPDQRIPAASASRRGEAVYEAIPRHAPEMRGHRQCFCGATYYAGNRNCSRGQRCPRQLLGYGHWHKAYRRLKGMTDRDRGAYLADFPAMDFGRLEAHVLRLQNQRADSIAHFEYL